MERAPYQSLRCAAARLAVVLALLAGLFGPPRAQAVAFDPLSIEALTAQADVILQGTVRSRTCLSDATGRIFTQIELDVADVWKGAISRSPFLVVHGGGALGDRQSIVGGQVEYVIGEEVVVFLTRNARGEAITLGLKQGKFQIWKDPQTGIKFAASPFHGGGGAGAKAALQRSTSSAGGSLELTQFRKRVEDASQ